MKKIYLLLMCASSLASCNTEKFIEPGDKQATAETRGLYHSMQRMAAEGIMFGHHDDTGYGVGWQYDNDSSDVKGVCGNFPAVYGWDLAKIEHDSETDINGLPFVVQAKRAEDAYKRGGINTYCWHMDNPADSLSAWDTTRNTIADMLPGGDHNTDYEQYLNRAAKYLASLKGEGGEDIPVLFRPFHEMTGDWFWWGTKGGSADDFKKLWRFTIDYLRNTWNLHNLLIVYSAADFRSEAEFLARYPGDDYVDFMGFDSYCLKNPGAFGSYLDRKLTMLENIANAHHKLTCLAETGYLNIPQPDWWTRVLLPAVSRHKISYLMIWRNADENQYYAPYPGQQSAADFKTFSQSDRMIFQNKLTEEKIYGR